VPGDRVEAEAEGVGAEGVGAEVVEVAVEEGGGGKR